MVLSSADRRKRHARRLIALGVIGVGCDGRCLAWTGGPVLTNEMTKLHLERVQSGSSDGVRELDVCAERLAENSRGRRDSKYPAHVLPSLSRPP